MVQGEGGGEKGEGFIFSLWSKVLLVYVFVFAAKCCGSPVLLGTYLHLGEQSCHANEYFNVRLDCLCALFDTGTRDLQCLTCSAQPME